MPPISWGLRAQGGSGGLGRESGRVQRVGQAGLQLRGSGQESEHYVQRDPLRNMYPYVHCSSVYNSQHMEARS